MRSAQSAVTDLIYATTAIGSVVCHLE